LLEARRLYHSSVVATAAFVAQDGVLGSMSRPPTEHYKPLSFTYAQFVEKSCLYERVGYHESHRGPFPGGGTTVYMF
jgi:hypothetical protein